MVPYIHGYAFALAEVLLSCHLILHKDQIRYDIRLDKLGYQKPSKNYYMIPDDKCIGRHFFFLIINWFCIFCTNFWKVTLLFQQNQN